MLEAIDIALAFFLIFVGSALSTSVRIENHWRREPKLLQIIGTVIFAGKVQKAWGIHPNRIANFIRSWIGVD